MSILDWIEFFTTLVLLAATPLFEVVAATFLVARTLPRRQRFGVRMAVASLALFVFVYVVAAVANTLTPTDAGSVVAQLYTVGTSTLILVGNVAVVRACFDASIWRALFCAAAGYTIQNLASGLMELVFLVLRETTGINLSIGLEAWLGEGSFTSSIASTLANVGIFALVLWAVYLLFVRQLNERGLDEVEDHKMLAMIFFVILAVIAFDVFIKAVDDAGLAPALVGGLRIVHLMVCVFALFVQFEMLYSKTLEARVEADRLIAAERARQYELSRANIDAINQKCHDIKHEIHQLAGSSGIVVDQAFVASLEQEVAVYDSLVHTGNEALDTVLSEKGLVCEREGVELTCIADGEALGLMDPSEIYALFGNALDNAIRAAREVPPEGRRSVSVVVRRVGALVSVHVENGMAPAAAPLAFEDGLPQTTQAGPGHGFGTRSMRSIVERHGGTITFDVEPDSFVVNALIPVP